MTGNELIQLFGALAGLAVVIIALLKWVKPRLEKAEQEKDASIAELKQQVAQLYAERDAAKDVVIAAFGDIGDAFQSFASDLRSVMSDEITNHEASAEQRADRIMKHIDKTADTLVDKLRHRSDDL